MSETEESESDLDFSASEDEYIPTDEADTENEYDDDDNNEEEEEVMKAKTPKKATKRTQSRNPRKTATSEDESDSSVENYLVNPNEIDLASDFFNPNKIITSNVPKFDCNIGLNLSDSDEEVFEDVPSTSQNAAGKLLDFNAHANFNKDLENAKNQLRNFKSTNFGQDTTTQVDVSKLLAMGEPSLVASKSSQSRRRKDLISSDDSDFEEVKEDVRDENRDDVEVRIGPTVKQKPNKLQAEIEASIKRKINRRTKENQLMMHKVHVLSWVAYGNYVNKVLNSTKLMEMVLKYMPSDKCYPKEQTDQEYFEQISRWFKTTVGLKNKEQNCNLKCLPPIATSLALQIQSKMAICKKDFVFIFIILLRSIGIQCRLVINLATVPMRPPAKDLCVISTKSAETSSAISVKKEKKSTKTAKESSNDRSKQKDVKKSKAKPKVETPNVNGQLTGILTKIPEASKQKPSLKSKIEAALKSNKNQSNGPPNDVSKNKLKRRSLSLQQTSSVDDNAKRSRVTRSKDTKTTNLPKIQNVDEISSNKASAKGLKLRSASEKNSSSIKEPSETKSRKAVEMPVINTAIASFAYRRTRAAANRGSTSSATITSQSIPQLDGGDDKKSKKTKPNLYKLKFPLRSRSVSPTSSSKQTQRRSQSTAIVSPRGRSKTNLRKIKTPRSMSRSPTSTSGHISRKAKAIESNAPSPSSKKSSARSGSVDTEKQENILGKGKPKAVQPQSNSLKPTTSIATMRPDSPMITNSSKFDKKLVFSTKDPITIVTKAPKTKPSSESVAPSANKERPKRIVKAKGEKKSTSTATSAKSAKTTKQSDTDTKAVTTSTSKEKSTPMITSTNTEEFKKASTKRKAIKPASSDSDFAPTPNKKSSQAVEKPLPKPAEKLKKRIDRRILSTDDESIEPSVKKDDMNYWIEVYSEADSKWICIDAFKAKVKCVDEIKKKATKPIAYVFAWNNNNKVKDVSPRYCSQWNTTTRKLRVEPEWLNKALRRYKEPLSQRCVAEDRELEEIHAQTPIPTSISDFKNHPLYALPRHLLKFEGIYPPNPVPIAYIRGEPIYSRLCVHSLHSREIWVKQARVVKPGETPYKIVKARPKWDRLANKMLEPQPLEIFGRWQTEQFVPPTAENGIVPRNAYGNVELFKPEMLPKKTVHLRLAGLNKVCAKLKIDCAQAVVGFDFHGGSSHPTFDGFVVCEEFAELVTEAWCEEQEESYRKSKEKQTARIYGNWKKLIKGVLIRERLQRKYNFAGKYASTSSSNKK